MRIPRTRFTRACAGSALGLFLLFSASGCGGGKGDVSGEVTVGGKPLPMGFIVFTPESGPAVAAEIIDGKYSAVGVPTGNVKVSLDLGALKQQVEKAAPKSGMASMAMKFGKGKDADPNKEKSMNPGKGGPEMPQDAKDYFAGQQKTSAEASRRLKESMALLPEIPEKYTNPGSSGWTLTVSRGSNTFDAKVTK